MASLALLKGGLKLIGATSGKTLGFIRSASKVAKKVAPIVKKGTDAYAKAQPYIKKGTDAYAKAQPLIKAGTDTYNTFKKNKAASKANYHGGPGNEGGARQPNYQGGPGNEGQPTTTPTRNTPRFRLKGGEGMDMAAAQNIAKGLSSKNRSRRR